MRPSSSSLNRDGPDLPRSGRQAPARVRPGPLAPFGLEQTARLSILAPPWRPIPALTA